MTSDTLSGLLVIFLVAMYLLAMLYLRRRQLSPRAYLFWGLFALLVPALGPFLLIWTRPGKPRQATTSPGTSSGGEK